MSIMIWLVCTYVLLPAEPEGVTDRYQVMVSQPLYERLKNESGDEAKRRLCTRVNYQADRAAFTLVEE